MQLCITVCMAKNVKMIGVNSTNTLLVRNDTLQIMELISSNSTWNYNNEYNPIYLLTK